MLHLPSHGAGFRRQNFLFPNRLGIPEGRLSPPWLGALVGRLSHPLDRGFLWARQAVRPLRQGHLLKAALGVF